MAAVGFGVVGYELWPRDETRIADLLNDLCAQFNEMRDPSSLARLKQSVNAALLPAASVRVAELGMDAEGREQITHYMAGELLAAGVPLSFSLSSMELHVVGRLARVDLDLLVMPRGSGEQRRDLRHTSVRLNKTGRDWKIESVEIDGVAESQPEARP
ncbi:MAG: hypothetical protein ABI488_10890 [Polyangiaceae bacterium]